LSYNREYYLHNRKRILDNNKKWHKNNKDRVNKIKKKWKDNNKTKVREYNHKTNRQLKLDIINILGGFCVCCKEATWEFLSLDHVNNDGYIERKSKQQHTIYREIRDGKADLNKYQLLCYNCNSSKGHYGYCPHMERPNNSI